MSLKLVLFDRDGVINRKVIGGYVNSVEDFHVDAAIFELLRFLDSGGVSTAIVTNQQGLGKKTTSYSNFFGIHGGFADECVKKNITPPLLFYCPHIEETCQCRKPKSGMLLAALEIFQVLIEEVLLIGDSKSDVSAAKSIGMQSLHLFANYPDEKCFCGAEIHLSTIESCTELMSRDQFLENFK